MISDLFKLKLFFYTPVVCPFFTDLYLIIIIDLGCCLVEEYIDSHGLTVPPDSVTSFLMLLNIYRAS